MSGSPLTQDAFDAFTTTALDTVKSKPDYERRLIELIDDNSDLRQELRFLRTVYASTDELMASIHSVTQQMIPNYHI